MTIDLNNIVNDLWHSALNNFKFLENRSHNNKKPQHDVYINKINDSVNIEAIVITPWLAWKLFDSELKTVIKLHIVIHSQKLKYTKELRIKYNSSHNKNLTKIAEFKIFFDNFKENIRLFNWDV